MLYEVDIEDARMSSVKYMTLCLLKLGNMTVRQSFFFRRPENWD